MSQRRVYSAIVESVFGNIGGIEVEVKQGRVTRIDRPRKPLTGWQAAAVEAFGHKVRGYVFAGAHPFHAIELAGAFGVRVVVGDAVKVAVECAIASAQVR